MTDAIDLHALLSDFLKAGASDLHLTEETVPSLRVHGDIVPMPGAAPLAAAEMERLTRELLGENDYALLCREREIDRAVTFGEYRLRINAYFQQGRLSWALRALPRDFFPLEKLGLPETVIQRAVTLQKGLILVTGATGSGKSTTMASILNEINATRPCHIFTIEDPIEYVHPPKKAFVSQREIGTDSASFSEALRRILREDPDVVLIGEMRDTETMRMALTLAETGHLTFATLHTSDAVQTITRLIGSFPANEQELIRTQLSTTLAMVICQQLIPWRNRKGRSVAAEILVVQPAVQALIRENKIHQIFSVMQTQFAAGMRTMDDALFALWKKALIERDTALTYASNRETLARKIDAESIE